MLLTLEYHGRGRLPSRAARRTGHPSGYEPVDPAEIRGSSRGVRADPRPSPRRRRLSPPPARSADRSDPPGAPAAGADRDPGGRPASRGLPSGPARPGAGRATAGPGPVRPGTRTGRITDAGAGPPDDDLAWTAQPPGRLRKVPIPRTRLPVA